VLLINNPEIIVITDPGNYFLSARNCLRGTVTRVQYDGVYSEIVLNLPSGESLVVTISQASALSLGLNPGVSAYAVFKSNAVIIGALSKDRDQPLTKKKLSVAENFGSPVG
jgi:molybdate transport system regulatory protein